MAKRPMEIVREVLLWIISLFLVWVFLRQGYAKFSDTSGWARAFRVWHYPDWFRMLIGGIEVVAALLLLWPRVAAVGAVMIICVMLGAMGTHLWFGPARHVTSEILPLTLATVIAFMRYRRLRE